MANAFKVEAMVNATRDHIWEYFTNPQHIVGWNFASDDWYCPKATNDLEEGGSFNYRMQARDGSAGFDLVGTYDDIVPHELIEYTLSDGRSVAVTFDTQANNTFITMEVDPESQNSVEMQQHGWQAILDNFKKYAETRG
jgi:uncharacterized protein YndB with AHSA1/START domain